MSTTRRTRRGPLGSLALIAVLAVVALGAIGPAHAAKPAQPGRSTQAHSQSTGHGPPCDGCVGKADDKTPKGQSAGDKNKGHECDGNNGIGKGNPAHTGCTTPTVTPPTPGGGTVVSPPEALTPPGVVVSPPRARVAHASVTATVLPSTGAAADLTWLAVAGLLLAAAGSLLIGRVRVRA